MADVVHEDYWLRIADRYSVHRLDFADVTAKFGLRSIVRDRRRLILHGRYFRVQKARAHLSREFNSFLPNLYDNNNIEAE